MEAGHADCAPGGQTTERRPIMKPILAVLGARGLGACVARPASRRVRRRLLLMIAAGKAVRRNGNLAAAAPCGAAGR
jgi:hypothetical protein